MESMRLFEMMAAPLLATPEMMMEGNFINGLTQKYKLG